jgi:hypothetical protein
MPQDNLGVDAEGGALYGVAVRRALGLLACVVALAGCASLAKDQTVCPEYRDLRCPAGASCSMDSGRGCRVCQCNAINTLGPVSAPDENVPPPVVLPEPSR